MLPKMPLTIILFFVAAVLVVYIIVRVIRTKVFTVADALASLAVVVAFFLAIIFAPIIPSVPPEDVIPTATRTPVEKIAPTYTPTPTEASPPVCRSDYIRDQSFEMIPLSFSWKEQSLGVHPLDLQHCDKDYAHSGNCFILLGAYNDINDVLCQNITISTDISSASITFWYWLASEDRTPGSDRFGVYIKNPSGTEILVRVAEIDNTKVTYSYVRYEYLFKSTDIEAILRVRGEIKVCLQMITNPESPSVISIDDILLKVCH